MSAPDPIQALRKSLFIQYCKVLGPAVLVFALWALLGKRVDIQPPIPLNILGPAVFIGAIALAVALPLYIRASFVRRVSGEKHVPQNEFLRFEKQLTAVAVAAAYVAAVGYLFEVSRFHFTGAFLAALYGAYYYFPTNKRVAFEMKIFRVRHGE